MLTARCALLIVVFGLLASVSCAGRRRADPSATQEVANCPGQAYLEVTNPLSESVDVYAGGNNAGQITGQAFLGTARPGTTRFPIERSLTARLWFVDAQGPVVSEAIRYAYRCEPT